MSDPSLQGRSNEKLGEFTRTLESRNKKFARASAAKKRVMIVEDVLWYLQQEILHPARGRYGSFMNKHGLPAVLTSADERTPIRTLLTKREGTQCHTCACQSGGTGQRNPRCSCKGRRGAQGAGEVKK